LPLLVPVEKAGAGSCLRILFLNDDSTDRLPGVDRHALRKGVSQKENTLQRLR
jgi:hypothetical protein